jgi:hypothetical protein
MEFCVRVLVNASGNGAALEQAGTMVPRYGVAWQRITNLSSFTAGKVDATCAARADLSENFAALVNSSAAIASAQAATTRA